MSDNESSGSIEELEALMAEYKTKEEADTKTSKRDVASSKQKHSSEKMDVPMDKVLFGDKSTFLNNLAKAVGEKGPNDSAANSIDDKTNSKKRKPAWTDADDDEIQVGEVKRATRFTGPLDHLRKDKTYKEYLTARFTRIVNQPNWASLDRKDNERGEGNSDDEELLHTVGFLEKSIGAPTLRPHDIHYKRLKDLNRATYAESVINSIQFHPTSTAALVAGDNCIATIYSIDGQKNEKLHNMRFRNYPLKCTRITPCGTKAIFGSSKPFYYNYDLLTARETRLMLPRDIPTFHAFELSPCGRYIAAVGRFGAVHLITAVTNEVINTFKQEEVAAGLCFTADSQRLLCNSRGSNVSIFSLRQQRLEHNFIDDGCIKGSALHLAPNQRLLATGSKEGVVNVYDFERVQQTHNPRPEKSFMNLTTAISSVRFNHSSELLAMNSYAAPSAVKLAQFPSATVFANFPGFQANVGKIRTIEFSPNSRYLAMGNTEKKVPLYRLKHFKNY